VVLLVAALIVAGAIAWGSIRIADELKETRREVVHARTLEVLRTFTQAPAEAAADPRALLAWEPLAKAARQIFPDEFVQLDRAYGSAFPFGAERIESAHAQWTTDWLAWERSHDADYKLKAAVVEEEIGRSAGSPVVRARLDAIEREKLEIYQRRYAEYVKVAKALQSLTSAS
jgi:hypothetical protein